MKDGETAMIWDEAGRGIEEKSKFISKIDHLKHQRLQFLPAITV